MPDEYVVLVDDDNNEIGQALKSEVHTDDTPLHRAFSSFIFNEKGEVLLQQRSSVKKTWPLVWSNSCCGHPQPGEKTKAAAQRRLHQELGLTLDQLWEILPEYRYRAELYGIVEHEICPVFVGFTSQTPKLNPAEVESIKWVPWSEFVAQVDSYDPPLSAWCIEETKLLAADKKFQKLLSQHTTAV